MIQVISGEPVASIAEELIALSKRFDAEVREPTPLVSPFWGSTLTPSTTEVYARELSSKSASNTITTLQPCIRFVDFGGLGDDFHSLFFYMWSCFFKDALSDLDNHMDNIFKALEAASLTKRENWFATYHPANTSKYADPNSTESFGLQLLKRAGLKNCFPVAGGATYLRSADTSQEPGRANHLKGTPAEQVSGPRIELFVEIKKGIFLEIATLVLFSGALNLPSGEVVEVTQALAVATGVERLSIVRFKKNSLYELGEYERISHQISQSVGEASVLFKREIQSLTALLIAAKAIGEFAPNMPTQSNFGPNKEKRRISREIQRLNLDIGISEE